MDILITASLLQKDFTGIAKKEIKRQPLMGPAMIAAGVVFIDRESSKDPKQVLKPAVDALKKGRSVLVAPEGTPVLGRVSSSKRVPTTMFTNG